MLRQSVRVLLLDAFDRVLLVRFHDGARSWWCTPGGGVEAGESDHETAERELREEVGLTSVELGPLIWTRRHAGTFRGQPFDQAERIHLARIVSHDRQPPPTSEHDAENIRWWTLDELLATDADLAPWALPTLLRALLTDGPPAVPLDVGV